MANLLDPSNPSEQEEPLSPVQQEMLDRLEANGASFYAELVHGIEVASSETLFKALWDLVWRGLVTNDTFAPLRALASRPAPGRRRGRRAPPTATAGRWSLVSKLVLEEKSETEKLHARTLLYLDRHGIVSRESLAIEPQIGGFGAIYPVLREMEETGRIRRGHFVEGGTSAQLAVPGAVDRLRALRESPAASRGVLLAATDPAQPYGTQLPWPTTRGGKPRRAVGAYVVLVDGFATLFVDRGGERVLVFEGEESEARTARIDQGLRALVRSIPRLGKSRIEIQEIDGEKPRASGLAERFVRAGFRAGYRGFEAEAPRDA